MITKKIQCPNCNAIKKGVLLEKFEESKGRVRVKCKKCDAYVTIDLENENIISVESKRK